MVDELEIVLDRDEIGDLVQSLAGRISRDYAGRDLVLVGVLKAAAPFLADLALAITLPVELAFVEASSYGSGTTSSGSVQMTRNLDRDIAGKHLLVVDCIADTGRTLSVIMGLLGERHPASVEAVVLLDKRCCRTVEVPVQYIGTEIPDRFLVGYGLDKDQQYRNLPYIAAIAEEAKA